MDLNLVQAALRGEPSRSALISPEGPALTYRDLSAEVERFATLLHGLGLRKEHRVALCLPNGVEAAVTYLGCMGVCAAAPLNPASRLDEMRKYLFDLGVHALVLPRDSKVQARGLLPPGSPVIEVALESNGRLAAGASFPTGTGAPIPARSEDCALVLHTSGTTGRPKQVSLLHRNLLTSARNLAGGYSLGPEDASLCVMPLFHVHGFVASLLAPLVSGGAVVLLRRFEPFSFWRTMRDFRATWFSASPALHLMLLARAQGEKPAVDRGRLRFLRSCSAALPAAARQEMENRFDVPVIEAYGMTEASHQISTNPLPPRIRKHGTVGFPEGVLVAIRDPHGAPLPSGARGEVVIRGPSVISSYQDAEVDRSSFHQGWFRTGDEGFLDADGYITLVGRIKELIVRGGEKISPWEVDAVLLEHPAVSEAAAFGQAHPIYGEEVAAAVVAKSPVTEKELIAHCRERLAEFKCPRSVWLLGSIPRTETGKARRRLLAETLGRP
jgi:acyl-CoA synthetase (AMP-forming)/AMP-acid ligase II